MTIIAAIAAVVLMLLSNGEGDGTTRRISYWILRLFLFGIVVRLLVVSLGGDATAIGPLVVFTAFLFPWTLTTRVFVPLGLWRCAYAMGSAARVAWEGTAGGGVVAAAWALARSGRATPNAISFLQRRRDAARSCSAAHLVATALLAEARGDRETARDVFASVGLLGSRVPALPRKLASEWLCAEAAERGAWTEVVELAQTATSRSRATRLLGAVARRLTGHSDAPSALALRALWILAPARRSTLEVLNRALSGSSAPRPDGKTDTPAEAAGPGHRPDTLALALDLHVAAISSHITPGSLGALGRAWDRALEDPNTRDGTLHRAAVLGAPSGSRVLADLELNIRRELATLLREREICLADLPGNSPMLSAAAHQVREDMLRELETAFDALGRRIDSKRAIGGVAEWREFASLRKMYLRAARLGGMSLRQVAFPDAHHRICSLAVWLWNERKEYVIAQGMFLWLLDEAIAVGDEEAIELQRKNTETAG